VEAIATHLIQLPNIMHAAETLKVLDTLYSNADTVTKFMIIKDIKNMSTQEFTIISSTIYTSAIVFDTGLKFIIAKAVEVSESEYKARMNHLKGDTLYTYLRLLKLDDCEFGSLKSGTSWVLLFSS
jgi:hypothetical protein